MRFLWFPLTAAITVLATGFIGLEYHQLWLFPSLAPTAYILAISPRLPMARWYNVVVGHLIGMLMGFLAVLLLGAGSFPSSMSSLHPVPIRIWASGLAIFCSLLLQIPLRALHPPSASTALLITLGSFSPSWSSACTIILGVLVSSVVGEIFRWLTLATLAKHSLRE